MAKPSKVKELQETIKHLQFELFYANQEIERLRVESSRSSSRYLAGCRSVGGITLPPGQ